MKWVKWVRERHKGYEAGTRVRDRYEAGTRGRRQAKGVQDTYEGYETGTRCMRQLSGL